MTLLSLENQSFQSNDSFLFLCSLTGEAQLHRKSHPPSLHTEALPWQCANENMSQASRLLFLQYCPETGTRHSNQKPTTRLLLSLLKDLESFFFSRLSNDSKSYKIFPVTSSYLKQTYLLGKLLKLANKQTECRCSKMQKDQHTFSRPRQCTPF